MSYNSSRYFVDTYFPLYFQTVRKTEPLDRWVGCGWVAGGWVAGRPCSNTTVAPLYYGADALTPRKTFKHNVVIEAITEASGSSKSKSSPASRMVVVTAARGKSVAGSYPKTRTSKASHIQILTATAETVATGNGVSTTEPVTRNTSTTEAAGTSLMGLTLFTRQQLSAAIFGISHSDGNCASISICGTIITGKSNSWATIGRKSHTLSDVTLIGTSKAFSEPREFTSAQRLWDIAHSEPPVKRILQILEISGI